MRRMIIGLVLFATACSQGVAAPQVDPTETVCTSSFCIDVPFGWSGEVDDTFISMHHELDPEHTFLTAGVLDMESIVTAAGGTWPVPTQDVVSALWTLIEDADAGTFERSQRMVGGAVRSWGDHETGHMWQLMFPVEGSMAIGIEIRAPNDSWESHADTVFSSVRISG